ncbi:C1 family peptidase [Mycoplasma zalophidermidis]|uniref:Aminopeptidase n=1 Tax=Mycoplasma zalophidermidis TaxID=398174 RepID=A0ABS6DRI2_9MOLU|nr:C1 family peptidase [Mycoplasma zalophidermidis]MBU4693531.1 biotin transporter BioY [Mycoplasma zalophidermidis]MCR8966509.1 biotin transporter BioY [Mycoplasma zalophidermidis]
MELEMKNVKKFYKNYKKNNTNKLIENAVTKNGVLNATYNNEVRAFHNNEFSDQTKKGGITNQKSSGRCWIFAALNVLKPITMKKLNVESFEYSQAYTMFWEKMEKANTYLSLIIQHPELDFQDRLFELFLGFGHQDGGYWEWAEALITKYGVVPKSVMPETFSSSNTSQLNDVLQICLYNATLELRSLVKNGATENEANSVKEQALNKVFEICAKALGLPPVEFDFEYRDKDKKFKKISKITPLKWLKKYTSEDYRKLVNLYADPRDIYPKNTMLAAKYFRGPIESKTLSFINVDMSEIKSALIKSIKAGEPVWFACDMGPQIDSKVGIMDTKLYQIDEAFGLNNKLTKADKLNMKLSVPNHAMTFVGVDLDENNNPIKWEVENSWGDDKGAKGYFSMSDSWFNEYVYSIIVNPKYVSQDTLNAQLKEPIEIEPWDPLSM